MMSAEIAAEPGIRAEVPRRAAPWPVVTASYLWWTLITMQSIGLVWMGFTFAQAARIGGPAWDILFTDVPIGFPTLIITAIEIVLVIRLRRGARPARVWLAVLAVPAAVSVVFMLAPMWQARVFAAASVDFMPPQDPARPVLWVICGLILAIALVAAILPFTGPVRRFFSEPQRVGGAESASAAVRGKAPGVVVAAFWLWWPLIVVEVLGLVGVAGPVVQEVSLMGYAYYSLLTALPVGLMLLALAVAQIVLSLRLLRGSRAARGWLLGLAILTAALAAVVVASTVSPLFSSLSSSEASWPIFAIAAVTAVVALLALAGAILPFSRSAKEYFTPSFAPEVKPGAQYRAAP